VLKSNVVVVYIYLVYCVRVFRFSLSLTTYYRENVNELKLNYIPS